MYQPRIVSRHNPLSQGDRCPSLPGGSKVIVSAEVYLRHASDGSRGNHTGMILIQATHHGSASILYVVCGGAVMAAVLSLPAGPALAIPGFQKVRTHAHW